MIDCGSYSPSDDFSPRAPNQLVVPSVVSATSDHLARRSWPDNKGYRALAGHSDSTGETGRVTDTIPDATDPEQDTDMVSESEEMSPRSDPALESDDGKDMAETGSEDEDCVPLGDDDLGRSSRVSLRTRINRRPIQDRPRQKRQTLQDMARPLKQWLYKNKDNPYPTKAEKVNLAVGSHMTLTQVSNWFANARRRLKNTVRRPGITWSNRIKMYNSHVVGNAELLSVSSGESSGCWSDDENTLTENEADDSLHDVSERLPSPDQKHSHSDAWNENNPKSVGSSPYSSPYYRPIRDNKKSYVTASDQSDHSYLTGPAGPGKFKNSIMQRYLNDAYHHTFSVHSPHTDMRRRNPSRGSMGSHDYEEMSSSSRSSPVPDHMGMFSQEDSNEELEAFVKQRKISEGTSEQNDLYWKEISAAMALTNLARSHHSGSPCF